MVMKLTKVQVSTLNDAAQIDFSKAKAMLEGINLVLGTNYGWHGKRVCWFENFENENGTNSRDHDARVHDAWVWAY